MKAQKEIATHEDPEDGAVRMSVFTTQTHCDECEQAAVMFIVYQTRKGDLTVTFVCDRHHAQAWREFEQTYPDTFVIHPGFLH